MELPPTNVYLVAIVVVDLVYIISDFSFCYTDYKMIDIKMVELHSGISGFVSELHNLLLIFQHVVFYG